LAQEVQTVYGHILRHGDFRHGIIEGKIMVRLLGEGKGWSYMHDIIEGRDYGQLKDLISDRSRWTDVLPL